jgi:hypothetical protein
MERLRCSASDAMAQLRTLADATSVSLPDLAATLTATTLSSDRSPDGSIARSGSLERVNHVIESSIPAPAAGAETGAAAGARTALGADGDDVASLLGTELKPFGVASVGIWLLRPGGVLELLGQHGQATVTAWRVIPPQLDCLAQRVVHGAPDIWWGSGPPDAEVVPLTGPPEARHAGRAVLALRDRGTGLIGVLELRWPGAFRLEEDDKQQITSLAAGGARVLATRLALGNLRAAAPVDPLFDLLDEIAGSVLAVSAVRDADGRVTDFAIDHVSAGYLDPAGRPAPEIKGLTLLEAYPVTTAGHRA